jgi:hypothetical protein
MTLRKRILQGNGVKEGPGYVAPPSAGRAERLASGVEEIGKRNVAARLDQGGIMEFMAAKPRACSSQRTIVEQFRPAITEMQAPLGEARRVAEEAGHGVADAFGVHDALTEDHVAPAFAMHGPASGEAGEPFLETCGFGERRAVELRVAARQPAGIASLGRRFVGER